MRTSRNLTMDKMTGRSRSEDGATGHRWAVILAGGDGKRLLPLTRAISGDERPKQFCNVLGGRSLLELTRQRMAKVISPRKTCVVVTKTHERFYSDLKEDASLVVQPSNQGTAPAIVYSLLRLRELDSNAVVGVFPSDHHFGSDRTFAACVRQAFATAEGEAARVVLLGIEPTEPETSYGWIEPGGLHSAGHPGLVFSVQSFWEKPSRPVAEQLIERGCFWNSFIMVGRVSAFLRLAARTLPRLAHRLEELRPALGTAREEQALGEAYRSVSPSSFAADVLAASSRELLVVRGKDLGWTDLGEVGRVLPFMQSAGRFVQNGELTQSIQPVPPQPHPEASQATHEPVTPETSEGAAPEETYAISAAQAAGQAPRRKS